jgi:hypothetical protein
MYIVPMGWLYVALMMAVAEATNDNGTVLGGAITFVLYGLVPVLLVLYLMGSPARRKAIKANEANEALALNHTASHAANHNVDAASQPGQHPPVAQDPAQPGSGLPGSAQPDAGRHPPAAAQGHSVAPVGKEP